MKKRSKKGTALAQKHQDSETIKRLKAELRWHKRRVGELEAENLSLRLQALPGPEFPYQITSADAEPRRTATRVLYGS